ncbi:TonB-dependent receptor plug domain-containing protein [Bacteroidota bacterium]
MRVVLYILSFFLVSTGAKSQFFLWDTLKLEEVTIYGVPIEKYAIGSRMTETDSMARRIYLSSTVADFLKMQSPVFIKSYGSGMSSTISFRGTGAEHTSVLWNGINISQPTMGQSDFSLFPMFAFGDIKLHHGSSGSLYGSGAIGGSVHLINNPIWEDMSSLELQQEIGSYNLFFTGVGYKLVKNNISSTTRVFRKTAVNDFEFENITIPGRPTYRQQNAGIEQWGFMQDLYYRTASGSYLFLNGWYNFSDREIQPSMADINNDDNQSDQSLRILGGYNHSSSLGHFIFKGGFIQDYMQFNDESPILTNQILGQADYDRDLGEKMDIKISGQINRIGADVESYGEIKDEVRGDIYGSFLWKPLNRVEISINARETAISGYGSGFSPSAGFNYLAFTGEKLMILIKSQVSQGFRVPTLNERFWQPGGNPDLKPEVSTNLEASIDMEWRHNAFSSTFGFTTYNMRVDDWIQWVPGASYWSPENLKKVHAYGFEVSTTHGYQVGYMNQHLRFNYALSRSINMEALNEYDRSAGKQLAYTPVHNFNVSWSVKFKKWFSMLEYCYTGKRYITSDNEDWLDPYNLVNLEAGRSFEIWKLKGNLSGRINNLVNEQYQVIRLRAMPGRNYSVKIRFNL